METMHIVKENETSFNEKQTKIFKKIIRFSWAGNAYEIKRTLGELAIEYIRSERIEGEGEKTRGEIAFHLYLLNWLIDDLRDLELKTLNETEKQLEFFGDIIGLNGWADLAYDIKNTINDLSLVWINSDRASKDGQQTREDLTSHMHLVNSLIDDLRDYELGGH